MDELQAANLVMAGLKAQLPEEKQNLATEIEQAITGVVSAYVDNAKEGDSETKAATVIGVTIAAASVQPLIESLN